MLNAKIFSQLIIAYKLSPFIKRAVIIKITVSAILFGYWSLGKTEVFRQLDLAVGEMKALDRKNEALMAKIKDVGMVNQAIQRMEFNVVDSGKVFARPRLDAELLTLVSLHAEAHDVQLLGLAAHPSKPVEKTHQDHHEPKGNSKEKTKPKPKGKQEQKQEPEPEPRIGYSTFDLKVQGPFAGIMGFIDGLIYDKRYLKFETMAIASVPPNPQASASLPSTPPSPPIATIAFGVYVLDDDDQEVMP